MRLVLMTAARQATTEVLPALGLLGHQVRVVAPELSSLLDGDSGDVVLVDARHDLIQARTLCGLLSSTGVRRPPRRLAVRDEPRPPEDVLNIPCVCSVGTERTV